MKRTVLNYIVIVVIAVSAAFTSCKKNNEDFIKAQKGDVFVAGFKLNEEGFFPRLWKNGIEQNLSYKTQKAEANNIYIFKGNVYITGCEYYGIGLEHAAIVWRNGVVQNLTDRTQSAALSVYVYNSDVYVAGYEYNEQGFKVAKLWKNGIGQNLTDGSSHIVNFQ